MYHRGETLPQLSKTSQLGILVLNIVLRNDEINREDIWLCLIKALVVFPAAFQL